MTQATTEPGKSFHIDVGGAPQTTSRGSPSFPVRAAAFPPTGRVDLDAALKTLAATKDRWARTPVRERIQVLGELVLGLQTVASRWVAACCDAKRIPQGSSRAGEEWGALACVVRLCQRWKESLSDIAARGTPRLPGPVAARPDGQLVVRVFPDGLYDRAMFPGMTGELWLEPGTTRDQLEARHAAVYRRAEPSGSVSLVLAAGNYANLAPGDILQKVFGDNCVVVMKTNPVNAYLGPLIQEAFRSLVDRDVLRVVYGGAEEGAYLAEHELVDELHLTGSDKTYDAIVFGPGEEGRRRKAERAPRVTKPFSCELGNLSPVIVVPGPWSESELAYQGEHIASTLTLNGGFNCFNTRMIVQHREWSQRQSLLDEVRRVLRQTPTHNAYYPGAAEIHDRFVAAHPEAERLGEPADGHLPWTLIPDVDPGRSDDLCFTSEPFCSLFSETALSAPGVPEFIDQAVRFVNESLWGSLTATILVHPRSLDDHKVAEAVDRAVANLRYGTVGVNLWGLMGFLFGTTTWGAFPGHQSHDIQSGSGTVNNTLMLPSVQKSVLRGPFVQKPKPLTFPSNRSAGKALERVLRFWGRPSPFGLLGVVAKVMRG